MPLVFPSDPSLGREYMGYSWDGEKWVCSVPTPFVDYSIEEQDTGIRWTNGRRIYQKTINLGTLPGEGTVTNFPHGIENIDIVISIEAMALSTDYFLPLPYVNGVYLPHNNGVYATLDNIILTVGGGLEPYTGAVTLRYTRTDR